MIMSQEEISRLLKRYNKSVGECVDFIKRGSQGNPFGQGNPYFGLSITLRGICYLDIAINDYSSAIGSLFSAARVQNWLYEKQGFGWNINPQILASGNWQFLLLSLLTEDDQLINKFSRNFFQIVSKTDSIYGHTKDSRFIGRYLSALIENNLQEIDALHREKRPSIDRRFFGTYEILDAISHKDVDHFVTALVKGGEYWEKYMKRYKTEDDAICYLYGACFVKLAERNFKKKINIEIPQFPKQLLEVKSYTPYPLPETIFE
jgi:hypothetical protein